MEPYESTGTTKQLHAEKRFPGDLGITDSRLLMGIVNFIKILPETLANLHQWRCGLHPIHGKQ